MNFAHRQALFSQIEASRARPLIAYVTSLRPNAGGQMWPDAIPELARIEVKSVKQMAQDKAAARANATAADKGKITKEPAH